MQDGSVGFARCWGLLSKDGVLPESCEASENNFSARNNTGRPGRYTRANGLFIWKGRIG